MNNDPCTRIQDTPTIRAQGTPNLSHSMLSVRVADLPSTGIVLSEFPRLTPFENESSARLGILFGWLGLDSSVFGVV